MFVACEQLFTNQLRPLQILKAPAGTENERAPGTARRSYLARALRTSESVTKKS